MRSAWDRRLLPIDRRIATGGRSRGDKLARDGGREGGREEGMEGGREEGMDGWMEGGREGGREGGIEVINLQPVREFWRHTLIHQSMG
jgi:hypothetical protein